MNGSGRNIGRKSLEIFYPWRALAWPHLPPSLSRSDSLTILTLSCLKMVLPNWNILEQLTQWTKDFVAFRYISDLAE